MPTDVRLLRAPGLADTDYAYAATAPADSRIVHLAGACPLNTDGDVVGDDVESQAHLVIDNLVEALAAAGATLEDVLYTRVLVATADRDELVAGWTAVRSRFGDHDVPSTLLGVTVLGYPGQLIEVEAVAAARD